MRPLITVQDRRFEELISAENIRKRVGEMALEIGEKWSEHNPLFLCVLNGAIYFAADLTRKFKFPCELSCVKVSSYDGMESSVLRTLIGVDESVNGRAVIILEDIVDTGKTLKYLYEKLREAGAASVETAAFLYKPGKSGVEVKPDFTGYEVTDRFLVGYGLDYNKQGRNFQSVYQLKS